MNRRTLPGLLAGLALTVPLALLAHPAAAQTVTRPSHEFVISIGRGELITLPSRITDVYVANDNVADVHIKSTTQLYVFGKSAGETTIYASNAAGQTVWSANVRVGSNMDGVDRMLRMAMPDAKISVATLNGTVLLTGTVATPEDAAEAERLTKAFVGGTTNVISRLKMATPLQVNLQVRFAEVSRSLSKSIASNLSTISGSGIKFGIAQGRSASSTFSTDPNLPLGTTGGSVTGYTIDPTTGKIAQMPGTAVSPVLGLSTIAAQGKLFGFNILAALDAGEQAGLVTTLSQPNLTALSGETADFQAGGEYPIPISNGLGTTTIQYKKYGVSLTYTPTVLANGRIAIKVAPEVSELSSQGAVNINGFTVPALTVRRAETTVELGSGQSFMIAGLMSNNAQQTLQKTPGAGDIPILGALFRSTSFQKGQTELVIVITPYLVNPVDANDIKLPTDGFRTPNTLQQLFGNMDNDGKSGADRPKPTQRTSGGANGAPVPTLGVNDLPPAPPASAPAAASATPAVPAKGKQQASAAPGFSF